MVLLKGSAEIRKGRRSILNAVYHVTFATKNRHAVFNDFQMACTMRRSLKNSDDNKYSQTLAFCIMPDHVHWLFVLTTDSLSKTVARVKAEFSRNAEIKIWQDGFHDQGVRTDHSLINIARYIVANPIKAELVRQVSQYSHWDSAWVD